MRIAVRIAALTALWVLAWGDVSPPSVIGGVVISSLLLLAFRPGPPSDIGFHPVGFLRLLGYIAVQLVTSNVLMSWQVIRPRPALAPGVLAYRLGRPTEEVVTAMTSVIALSPGTMTVDVTADSSTIYVHFLFLDDQQEARDSLARLERLVVAALDVEERVPAGTPQGEPS